MNIIDKFMMLVRLKFEEWNLKWDERIWKKAEDVDFLQQQLEMKKTKIVKKREDFDNRVIEVEATEDISYVPLEAKNPIVEFELPMPRKQFSETPKAKTYHDYKTYADQTIRGGYGNQTLIDLHTMTYVENRLVIPGMSNMLTVKHLDSSSTSPFKFFVDEFGLYLSHNLDRFEINHKVIWKDIHDNAYYGFTKERAYNLAYREFPEPVIEFAEIGIGELRLVINAKYAPELSCDSVLSTEKSTASSSEPAYPNPGDIWWDLQNPAPPAMETIDEVNKAMIYRMQRDMGIYRNRTDEQVAKLHSHSTSHIAPPPPSSLKPRRVKEF